MLDSKNIELKIKDGAKEALEKKIKPGQVVLLALNDGSNGYSKLGGTCTIGANFQLVLLDHEDPDFSIKIKNNMDLNMYTSDKDRTASRALRTNPSSKNANSLSDVYIFKSILFLILIEKLSADEMKKLGGKIC